MISFGHLPAMRGEGRIMSKQQEEVEEEEAVYSKRLDTVWSNQVWHTTSTAEPEPHHFGDAVPALSTAALEL
jgi:hypothetical protein